MAAFRPRLTAVYGWSLTARRSLPTAARLIKLRPVAPSALLHTTVRRARPEMASIAGLSLDHEICRPHQEQQPLLRDHASSQSASEGVEDWLDVCEDSAAAEEAIRAYKEDGVVLGLSNVNGQLNFIDQDVTSVQCGGLTGQQ